MLGSLDNTKLMLAGALPAGDPVDRVRGGPVSNCCKVSMLLRLIPADDPDKPVSPGTCRPCTDGDAAAAAPTDDETPEMPPMAVGSCGIV